MTTRSIYALLLALLAAIAVVAVVAVVAARRLRERRHRSRRGHRRASPARFPIVLAHGLFGYDVLEVDGDRREYFRGVSDRLVARGCTVYVARVPPVASIATRGAALARFLASVPDRRVHLIAHSMGGLDARYAIARLGVAGRVATLTTIGTPHRGTPMADLGVAIGKNLGLGTVLERLGLERQAFRDLTTAGTASFNAAIGDAPGVRYASVVGVVRSKQHAHPLLLATWALLRRTAGPNDGVVPASSQRWGEVVAEIDADHFAQVGCSTTFDASSFYERLVVELGE